MLKSMDIFFSELKSCQNLKSCETDWLLRDATHQTGKIRKFVKCQNVANKLIRWSIVV